MSRADYRGAADKYRRAVALDPDDMTIRFSLGTAHTFLAERRQAVEQFRVVVKRADPKSVEQREAKRWLAAAGIPAETDVARTAASSSPAKAAGESAGAPEKLVGGRLVGRMEWPGVDPKTRAIRGELSIHGAEAANEKVTQSRPISLGGRYHFYDIPAGQYRIIARLFNVPKDVTLWDQKGHGRGRPPDRAHPHPGNRPDPCRQVPAATPGRVASRAGYFRKVNAPAPSKACAIVAPRTSRVYS